MDAYQCVRTLRAVRSFRPDALGSEAIEHILQAGRWSGSSKNTQPWQFVVVQERARLEALSRCGAYAGHLAGAACGIVVVGEPGAGSLDLGRCAQNVKGPPPHGGGLVGGSRRVAFRRPDLDQA